MRVVTNYRKAAEAALIKENPGIAEQYKAQMRAMGTAVTTPRGAMPTIRPRVFINP
jgi:hypothetical protein